MLKLAIVFLFGVVWGGRLENTYLPPGGAQTAGGNGNLLKTPFANGNGGNVVGDGVAPISGTSRIGSNVIGSIGNGNFRKNGSFNRVYERPSFNGAPISSDVIGIDAQLSQEYGTPVITGGSVGVGTSNGLSSAYGAPVQNGNPTPNAGSGSSNGLSSVYGVPVQNGIPVSNTGIGSSNGLSSAYGIPAQNGIPAINTGSYSGPKGVPANILRYNSENDGTGIYRFEYETENHISQEERGDLKNIGTNSESTVVQGTYSYAGPDGHTYTVNYIADENGFQPTGDHIHLAVQAAAADAARTAGAEGNVGGYSSEGQYKSTANGGYQY